MGSAMGLLAAGTGSLQHKLLHAAWAPWVKPIESFNHDQLLSYLEEEFEVPSLD